MSIKHRILPELSVQQVSKFWKKVKIPPNGCWEWQGYCHRGYGVVSFRVQGKDLLFQSHRISYKLYYLKDPINLCVCHTCDNPRCVNPLHLFLGTYGENNTDRHLKGRSARLQGIESPNAKLNEQSVKYIRQIFNEGKTMTEIAAYFNISRQQIGHIVHHQQWKHI